MRIDSGKDEQTIMVSRSCKEEEEQELRIEWRERERGVQYGAAVVTVANAAWSDVSLAAELS